MEYVNDILCFEEKWLIDNAIITESNIKYYCRIGKINKVRVGGNGRSCLISYRSIPENFKAKIISVMGGDPEKLANRNKLESRITADAKARAYYAKYKKPNGINIDGKLQLTYCVNVDIMNAIHEIITEKSGLRKTAGIRKWDMWKNISEAVFKLDKSKYNHNLNTSDRRLEQQYNRYLEMGYDAFIPLSRIGNSNNCKINEMVERLILSIHRMSTQPYEVLTCRRYNEFVVGDLEIYDKQTGECFNPSDFVNEKTGAPLTLSQSSVSNIINKKINRAVVDSYRLDQQKYKDKHRPFHHGAPLTYSLSMVSLDDRDLPRKSKKGKPKCYYAYDVMSHALIGYAYSMNKDEALFVDCMRNMFQFLHVHGLGIPAEAQVEHHLVNNFKNDLMKAGIVFPFVRWCVPGNSQEKFAERFIGIKKMGFEKLYQDGIGRFYAKREADMKKQKRDFKADDKDVNIEKTYRYDELVADDIAIINEYNNGLHPDQKRFKGKSRLQVLLENVHPNLTHYDEPVLARYIGDSTKSTTVYNNQYVKAFSEKYVLPNVDVLEAIDSEIELKAYALPNLDGIIEKIHLFQDSNYLCTCEKLIGYKRATIEQTESDMDIMKGYREYIENFDKKVKEGRSKLAKITIEKKDTKKYEDIPVKIVKQEEILVEDEFSGYVPRRSWENYS